MKMYFSFAQIASSLENLSRFHPFFGITFLVCKQNELPVGSTKDVSLDAEERKFLEKFYKPPINTSFYMRVFRPSNKSQHWLDEKYPGAGSQSTRTRGDLSEAFIHQTNSNSWGWASNYINILNMQMIIKTKGKLFPAFDLAVWLFREKEFSSSTTYQDVVNNFFTAFHITKEEQDKLFSTSIPKNKNIFVDEKTSWEELQTIFGNPPDVISSGGILTYLELRSIGPVKMVSIEPGKRFNLITGDNGLGKTFLVDVAWWSLTGQWPEYPAIPFAESNQKEPKIIYQISTESGKANKITVNYNWESQNWPSREKQPTLPGLIIYARVDGSFAIWDPIQHASYDKNYSGFSPNQFYLFKNKDVWDGLERLTIFNDKNQVICNGLIRDWISWQRRKIDSPFKYLINVLQRLSPQDELGPLTPGEPVRIPFDAREIPTIKHSYADVPLIFAAAGVKRVVSFAYLVVWAWEEHKAKSKLSKQVPQNKMVILIDEVELHLHPKWQRVFIPALLHLAKDLDSELDIQFIVTTYSPLVTMSMEPIFDNEKDKLFHLEIEKEDLYRSNVTSNELPFIKHGQVDSWLESDVFELEHARSVDAEDALKKAISIQEEEKPDPNEVKRIHKLLLDLLPSEDSFWARWTYFAKTHGVEI